MVKPLETKDISANPFLTDLQDSDLVQALRVIRPRIAWLIAPVVMIGAGLAGWIATIPLN